MPTDLHQLALDRFKLAAEAEAKQRERELRDLRFAAREHWPDEIKAQRAGQQTPWGPISARPCLTIDKFRQPISQLENQQKSARLAVQISPRGGRARKKTAEILQGLYRHIEVESRAHLARNWAYSRALKCGRGAYRILTTYANDGDFDQDIVIQRILNQAAVYFDPFAQQPDWSDGEWCFIVEDMPFKKYKKAYPKSDVAAMDDEALSSLGDAAPGWVGGDTGEGRTVRVAEYFYLETKTQELVVTAKGWQGFKDAEDFPQDDPVLQSRAVEVRQLKWCKLNGAEILEEADRDGRFIPVIPVVGTEENLNGERRWEGVVAPAMDSNLRYDYMVSAEVETMALAPKAPFMVAEGQTEPYKAMYEQANVRNFPALYYKPTTLAGLLVPPPQRQYGEPPIQAIAQSIRQADEDIKAETGFYDATDPNRRNTEQSGRAITARMQQSERVNNGFLDSLANVSMTYEAKVILDLIPHVYDRPGRVARILGTDDEPQAVMLNMPFMRDAEGQPQAIPPGMPRPPEAEEYDLRDGSYSVTVSIGKAYSTLAEEGVALMGDLVSAVPQIAPFIMDLWIGDMDFPGAQEIADRLKKMLPPALQEGEQGQPPQIPPAVQQQMEAMGQQLQQLQAALQEAQSGIQVKALEVQSKEKIAAAEIAAKVEIEQIKARLQFQIAELERQSQEAQTVFKANRDAQEQAQNREAEERRAEREGERLMTQEQ